MRSYGHRPAYRSIRARSLEPGGRRAGRHGLAYRCQAVTAREELAARAGLPRSLAPPTRSTSWATSLGVVALAILVLDRTDSALATTALFLAAEFAARASSPRCSPPRWTSAPVGRVAARALRPRGGAFAGLALLAGAFSLPAVLALGVRSTACWR